MATSNKSRCFTIMIVPHSEEATYSLRLPLYIVQAAVALLILSVAGLSFLGYAYINASAEAREARILRQVNMAQQEEIDALAVETQRMMDHVSALDDLVEMVTESLDLSDDQLEDLMQNQASGNSNGTYELDNLEHARLTYASRSSTGGVLERAVNNITLLQSAVPAQAETLDSVGEYMTQAEAKPSIWPARGRISSGFGVRKTPYARGSYQFHTGVDIIGSHGSAIYAAANGRVVFTGYRGSYGNMIIIDHDYGYETLYAHLSGFAVSAGDRVETGQTIGYMGASGRVTGTHLHYEVLYNNTPVNPTNFMNKR